MSVRGKLVNKQRRWMSLLKRQLIQAIRGRVKEGGRGADTCWVNGSKYRPKAEEKLKISMMGTIFFILLLHLNRLNIKT